MLKRKVKDCFEANPAIIFFETSSETVRDNDIDFDVKLIKSLDKKPTAKDNQNKASPFLEPFEPDLFLAKLSDTHNLLFNKFCIAKEHALITTITQQLQLSHPRRWQVLLQLQQLQRRFCSL